MNIVSMVTGTLMGKMGCTKIKDAALKYGDIDGTFKRSLTELISGKFC